MWMCRAYYYILYSIFCITAAAHSMYTQYTHTVNCKCGLQNKSIVFLQYFYILLYNLKFHYQIFGNEWNAYLFLTTGMSYNKNNKLKYVLLVLVGPLLSTIRYTVYVYTAVMFATTCCYTTDLDLDLGFQDLHWTNHR